MQLVAVISEGAGYPAPPSYPQSSGHQNTSSVLPLFMFILGDKAVAFLGREARGTVSNYQVVSLLGRNQGALGRQGDREGAGKPSLVQRERRVRSTGGCG